ncbi:MAG TPA: LysR family transcriptional regulator [Pusillimonas sp.]|uniref:LysR family transcriptional regulator n=1 Tax=Pusillimonas sp. TaxID=3040095 RepID=UPI002B4B0F29|nr:LysR family transcriptional regulator [Pusillimonas sp.]HLU19355.1 LysR family transcriptional regulator [Pusillimonas sp.]
MSGSSSGIDRSAPMALLKNIETFTLVARTQSFAEAARQMRVARSVVTARVRQLEEYVGAPLFHRSTRIVRLTETGQEFQRDCEELVTRANSLIDQMRKSKSSPTGTLHIHALTGFVLGHFAAVLHSFQETYPDIRLDLQVSDSVVDPVKTGVDCALQIFPATSVDLVSKPLFPVRRVFCASPTYLQRHGTPRKPRDLHNHNLGLYARYPSRDRWTFHHGKNEDTLYLSAKLLTNSVHLLQEYALEHAGIVCIPTLVASKALLSGELVIILPDYILSSFNLSAVYAETSRNALKLRLFIQHINDHFGQVPPWDAALIARNLIPEKVIFS